MSGVSSQYVASSASIADGAVSEAKLAAEACSAAKMKKEGTATHVLTSNGAGAIPSYQAIGAVAQNLVPIETITLGADANQIDFDNITADTYESFFITFYLIGETGASGIGLTINDDGGANQYIGNYLYRITTSVACGNYSAVYLPLGQFNLADGAFLEGTITIGNLSQGYHGICTQVNNNTTTQGQSDTSTGFYKSTTQINAITLISAAQNFDVGSTATLWGLKKP